PRCPAPARPWQSAFCAGNSRPDGPLPGVGPWRDGGVSLPYRHLGRSEFTLTAESGHGRYPLPPLLPRTHPALASPLCRSPSLLGRGAFAPGHRRALGPALSHGPLLGARLPCPVPRRSRPPLFAEPHRGRPRRAADGQPARPEEPATADCRQVSL